MKRQASFGCSPRSDRHSSNNQKVKATLPSTAAPHQSAPLFAIGNATNEEGSWPHRPRGWSMWGTQGPANLVHSVSSPQMPIAGSHEIGIQGRTSNSQVAWLMFQGS